MRVKGCYSISLMDYYRFIWDRNVKISHPVPAAKYKRRGSVPPDMIFMYKIRTGVWGICFFLLVFTARSQPITGIWRGKMGSSRVELKLVRKGDSLTGTSYYYNSKSDYRRYSVKGYFDDRAMDVVWWDDVLLEDHCTRRIIGSGPGAHQRTKIQQQNENITDRHSGERRFYRTPFL
jgi:hypothetical protein